VGGLGLYFMRQVMDAVEFSFEGGGNKLVLIKRRENARP
jgi:anti-sigma regulatory factor (Ser/Thr protein kinase)